MRVRTAAENAEKLHLEVDALTSSSLDGSKWKQMIEFDRQTPSKNLQKDSFPPQALVTEIIEMLWGVSAVAMRVARSRIPYKHEQID